MTITEFFTSNPEIILIIIIWSLIWKGLSLYKAARREEKWWFVALLVINTLGFLEILYLFVFSRNRKIKQTEDKPSDQ